MGINRCRCTGRKGVKMGNNLNQLTLKSNEELKELLDMLSKKAQSDEMKLIAYVLLKKINNEI